MSRREIPGQQAFEWPAPIASSRWWPTGCEWPNTTGESRGHACGRAGEDDPALGLVLCWQHKRLVEDKLAGYLMLRPKLIQRMYWEAFIDPQLGELPDPGRAAVYFLERDGLIKIGTSAGVAKRARDIGKGSSMICGMTVGPVRVLGTMPGDHRHEDYLHRRFHHLRVDGEWFLPGEDLCLFIARRPDSDVDLLEELRIRRTGQEAS
jgi:T5orf172 domain